MPRMITAARVKNRPLMRSDRLEFHLCVRLDDESTQRVFPTARITTNPSSRRICRKTAPPQQSVVDSHPALRYSGISRSLASARLWESSVPVTASDRFPPKHKRGARGTLLRPLPSRYFPVFSLVRAIEKRTAKRAFHSRPTDLEPHPLSQAVRSHWSSAPRCILASWLSGKPNQPGPEPPRGFAPFGVSASTSAASSASCTTLALKPKTAEPGSTTQ